MNLTDLIYFQAKLNPERPALATPEEVVTYGTLVNAIDMACARIRALGFSRGDLVCLNMASTVTHAILMLALARLEIPSVSARFDHATEQAGLKPTAIFDVPPAPVLPGWRQVLVDESWFPAEGATADGVFASPSAGDIGALATIVLSSGTTGVPRAVGLTASIVEGRALHWGIVAPNGSPRSRCGEGMGLDAGMLPELLRVLWQGGLVCLSRKMETLANLTEHFRLTDLFMSPQQLSLLVQAQRHDKASLRSLQRIRVVGARLSSALLDEARALICRNVLHYYGSTETGLVALVPPAWARSEEGEAGFVVPWKRVEIVDDADQVLACGKEGKVRISGADGVDGYFIERPENRDVFRNGWFYPGDIGFVREDGMLVVTGRFTEIINRGGIKIAPAQIEGVLSRHPAIADLGVVGVANTQGLEEVWIAVVPRGEVSEDELLNFSRARLEPGKRPNGLVFVDAIPRNERGKVAGDRLRKLVKEKSQNKDGR